MFFPPAHPLLTHIGKIGVSGELPEERRRTDVSVSFIGSHGVLN